MKKQFLVINTVLASTLLLAACSNNTNEDNAKENKSNKTKYVEKEKKYIKDNTTEILIDSPSIKKEDIMKIVKHGDHWHVFTKDGKEHITYSDPNKIGEEGMALVSVVSLNKLKGLDVTSIKVHGDHWHVYTRDGQEFLTYENPSSLFSNIKIETYTGSHAPISSFSTNRINNTIANSQQDEVVKILVHGDHWHIYTASGQEFVSYSDPRHLYPNAEFGVYEGSHGNPSTNKTIIEKNNDNILPKPHIKPRIDSHKNHEHSDIISVLSIEELKKLKNISKILKHDDHYHIYVGDIEYITYTNPKEIFPQVEIGEYEGSHGNYENNNEHNNVVKWPIGVTRIVDHGDHWHLYIGNEEVGVVKTNPKSQYPKAEYIVEKGEDLSGIELNSDDIINYNSIDEKLVKSVIPYLDINLKAMTDFGNLDNPTSPVYGSNGVTKDIFYWLHGDHYHAETLTNILKKVKNGDFGNNSAKDVIATMKYIVNHPENKDEYLKVEIKIDIEKLTEFLMKEYDVDKSRILRISNTIDVYKNGQTKTFNLTEFTEKDGKIKYINGSLPKFNTDSEEVINSENNKVIDNSEKDSSVEINNYENEFSFKDKVVNFLLTYYQVNKSNVTKIGKIVYVYKNDDTKNFKFEDFREENGKIIYIKGNLPAFADAVIEDEDLHEEGNDSNIKNSTTEGNSDEKETQLIQSIANLLNISIDEAEDKVLDLVPVGIRISELKLVNDELVDKNGNKYLLKNN